MKLRVDSHGCYKFNHADLALGLRDTTAHFLFLLHLCTTNFPGPDSITRSEQAQQRRLERKATKQETRTASSEPDVPVQPLRENTVRAVSLWPLLHLKTFTGSSQAHS